MFGWAVGVFIVILLSSDARPFPCLVSMRFATVFIVTGSAFPAGDVMPFRLRSALCVGDSLVGLMPKEGFNFQGSGEHRASTDE